MKSKKVKNEEKKEVPKLKIPQKSQQEKINRFSNKKIVNLHMKKLHYENSRPFTTKARIREKVGKEKIL